MFLYSSDKSVNSTADLAVGTYRSLASVYRSITSDASAVLMEYGLASTNEVTACELLLIDHVGSQFHFDFVQLADGQWRSGSGQLAPSVGMLFPSEILDFRFVDKHEMSPQIVKAPNE